MPRPTINEEKRTYIPHEAQMDINRFEELMEEVKDRVEEAFALLPDDNDSSIRARAKAYWYEQIMGIVDGRGSMHTMDDTRKELEEWHSTEV